MDHVHHDHDHHHGHDRHHHDHGPVKGHTHDHAHHDHGHGMGDYFLEQLLTLFVCGSFGVVAILMYQFGMLNGLLSPMFHYWVLGGGIALLVLTAIRGLAVWKAAGAHSHDHAHGEACAHDHAHGADCGHDHGHAHAHDHSHEHGSIFWRVVVLAFPLLLFCLGLPNESFMKNYRDRRIGNDVALDALAEVTAKGGQLNFSFAELASAAYDPDKRAMAEGQSVTLKGQFKRVGDREFTLYRLKMTCCISDMIPVKARIVTEAPVLTVKPDEWVKVTGIVQFVQLPGQNQYTPVLRVKNRQGGIEPTSPEA